MKVLCGSCPAGFDDVESHRRHCVVSHSSVLRYACPLCPALLDRYLHTRQHYYRHLVRGRYKCDICSKTFAQKSYLNEHVEVVHGNPYSCNSCNKIFLTALGLKIHSLNHHSETKISYECKECGKKLNSRNGLTFHMTTHKLGHLYMCDLCGARFTQKVNLVIHFKRQHIERNFSCDVCDRKFPDRSTLESHRDSHDAIRQFPCKICNKAYKTERYMKTHLVKHNSVKGFVCGVCQKAYSSAPKLRDHLNTHTGERPFKCQYCDLRFTNGPNRIKHTKRMHGEVAVPKPTRGPIRATVLPQFNNSENIQIDRVPDVFDRKSVYVSAYPLVNTDDYSRTFSGSDSSVSKDCAIFCNDDHSDEIMSAALREQELELSDSYIREQMNGCDLTNFIPDVDYLAKIGIGSMSSSAYMMDPCKMQESAWNFKEISQVKLPFSRI